MLFSLIVGKKYEDAADTFINQLITEMDAEDVSHARRMAEEEIAKWQQLLKTNS